MSLKEILSGNSFLPHESPTKIIFMLHGYGDSAENFIHMVDQLDNMDLKVNYFALNAPSSIPNFSPGKQWFNLYPNGIYIEEVGAKEIKIMVRCNDCFFRCSFY